MVYSYVAIESQLNGGRHGDGMQAVQRFPRQEPAQVDAGKTGNPNKFRNFLIGEPLNRKIFCSQPYRLEEYSENHVVIDIEPVLNKTTLNFKGRDLEGINGQEFGNVEIVHDSKVMKRLRINADGAYKLL